MTTTKSRERMEFAVTMARETFKHGPPASVLAEALDELCRLSVRHGNLQEQRCNVPWTEAHEKAEARIEKRILKLCGELDPRIKVAFGGDPRGCTVKLVLSSGFTNDFAGEGVCVPQ